MDLPGQRLAGGPTESNQIKAIKVILSVLMVEGWAVNPTGSNRIKVIWRFLASSLG
jgi:hypothetical protein